MLTTMETYWMCTRGPRWSVAIITKYDKGIVHDVDMKFMIEIGIHNLLFTQGL